MKQIKKFTIFLNNQTNNISNSTNPVIVKTRLFSTQFKEFNISGLSSQIAYWMLLSFFPFILLFLSLIPLLPIDYSQLTIFIDNNFPDFLTDVLSSIIVNYQYTAEVNFVFLFWGTLFAAWSASKVIHITILTLNKIYTTSIVRHSLYQRFYSIFMTFFFIIVIFSSIMAYTFLSTIASFLSQFISFDYSFFMYLIKFLIIPLVVFSFIFILYHFSVNSKLKIKYSLPGSIFFTISFFVFLFIFSFYLTHFNSYSELYGVMGTVIILIMSFFYIALLILSGGLINNITFLEDKQSYSLAKKSNSKKTKRENKNNLTQNKDKKSKNING